MMVFLRKLVTAVIFLAAWQLQAQAQIAYVEDGLVHVPRINVGELGFQELRFQLSVEGKDLLVALVDMQEPDVNAPVSGVYDLFSGWMALNEVRVPNGKVFYAELEHLPDREGVVFRLLGAEYLYTYSPPPPNTDLSVVTAQQQADYQAMCAGCHGESGLGTSVGPTLTACATCTDLRTLSDYIADTMPLGQSGSCDQSCAEAMAAYILAQFNEARPESVARTVDGIQLLSPTQVLRKASMQLLGRLPSPQELSLVKEEGERGLSRVLDRMLEEEAFYERLAEIFNLYLLTDKYHSRNGSEAAIRLLNNDDFPERRWFDPGKEERGEDYEEIRGYTNDGLAREPLELIKHVVRQNRPFKEVLTADYLMVNSYAAKSYGLSGLGFANPDNAQEFVEARIPGIPHAGILTSTMFLNRYPSTFTNRNRGRARVVFDLFLDTDILAIEGSRPGSAVDLENDIPTLDNPECVKCHSVLDPVASIFQNWDYRGAYRPSRLHKGWFTDMEVRGFAGKAMPLSGNADNSVQWLAWQIAEDPRFPRAVMRIIYKGLTGREPLAAPGEEGGTHQEDAYWAEKAVLNEIQDDFVADDYNLKTLVKGVLMSPYWQAAGLSRDARDLVHTETGSTALLGPERLHKKLEAVLGIQWRGSLNSYHKNIGRDWSARLLNKSRYYQQIYGGIDSDGVVKPLESPNGLMGAVQLRMANEMACYAVPNEFLEQELRPESAPRLFPYVTQHTSPFTEEGDTDPAAMQLIRKNIRHLHRLILGEERSFDDPEFSFTEDLFMAALKAGQQEIASAEKKWQAENLPSQCARSNDLLSGANLKEEEGEDRRLRKDPDYLIRSWMAVVAYLLADYRFFYE